VSREHAGRVFVIFGKRNRGAGACRNIGVRWARERGSRLVLFHDADDISHPHRLEVIQRIMHMRSAVDFIYSPIVAIDEHGVDLPRDRLGPALQEILESHKSAPLQGSHAWIRMGIELGYTCVTSTVAVRTKLATAHPFPTVRFSEDQHTWLRMSAGGRGVAFAEWIPTRYRVPQNVRGQCSRDRLGEACDDIKASVDTSGFGEAMALAARRGDIGPEHQPLLWERFFLRLAQTMRSGGRDDLADDLTSRAMLARQSPCAH
jgi:glycosyltransferase involved in cell wall biosynthesis